MALDFLNLKLYKVRLGLALKFFEEVFEQIKKLEFCFLYINTNRGGK
jgi:hypothetical protein